MARLERPRGDGRYIVDCPACEGTGRIRHVDSVVLTGCRLCWERGVCSPIVANRYRKKLADAGEGAE
jgi:Ribonuclease G/E